MLESLLTSINFVTKALSSLWGAKEIHTGERTKKTLIELHLGLVKLHSAGTISLSLADWAIKNRSRNELQEFCDHFVNYASCFTEVGKYDRDGSVFTSLGLVVPSATEKIFQAMHGSSGFFGDIVQDDLYRTLLPGQADTANWELKQPRDYTEGELDTSLANLAILRQKINAAHSLLPDGLEHLRNFICTHYDFPAVTKTVQKIIADDPSLSISLPNKKSK